MSRDVHGETSETRKVTTVRGLAQKVGGKKGKSNLLVKQNNKSSEARGKRVRLQKGGRRGEGR